MITSGVVAIVVTDAVVVTVHVVIAVAVVVIYCQTTYLLFLQC
jgi:hypothetical protein